MKILLALLLQALIFLPLSSMASDGGGQPPGHVQDKREKNEAREARVISSYGRLPLYFIKNSGQLDRQVIFYEKGAGHTTFFTEKGLVLSLTRGERKKDARAHRASDTNTKHISEAVSLSFLGADNNAKIISDDKMAGKVNYFIGNDRKKWRTNIPTYGAVTYKDIYENIDIKFYGNNQRLEHDVIVRPGGDPLSVKFACKGAKGLKVTEDGDLEVILESGTVLENKPVIYQKIDGRRVLVAGGYTLLGKEGNSFLYGFKVASYDHTKDLVIDPVLAYSTYLGGTSDDYGHAIAVDNSGSAYIFGQTGSNDFPTAGPLQASRAGSWDAFITKMNSSGTALVYSTYLGGTGLEQAYGIAVDGAGAAYVTGYTWATDFPVVNPLQPLPGGGLGDAFVTKVAPSGGALVYSTYLGGSSTDRDLASAVNASG